MVGTDGVDKMKEGPPTPVILIDICAGSKNLASTNNHLPNKVQPILLINPLNLSTIKILSI